MEILSGCLTAWSPFKPPSRERGRVVTRTATRNLIATLLCLGETFVANFRFVAVVYIKIHCSSTNDNSEAGLNRTCSDNKNYHVTEDKNTMQSIEHNLVCVWVYGDFSEATRRISVKLFTIDHHSGGCYKS